MDILYKDTISDHIYGKEWKIIMILEIVDFLNENMFLLSNICIT